MTIEQKAQRYDEALKRAKKLYERGTITEILGHIFPELKEFEDERIRNLIINHLTQERGSLSNYEAAEAIAWLEKQGEQKPTNKIEPKFKVGDWVVVSTAEGDRVVQIASIEYFKDGHPSYFTTEGRWFGNGTKARLLTDKDVETITLPESKIIVKQKPAWSKEDEEKLISCIEAIEACYKWDDMVDWLKSLKERYTWKPSNKQMKALHDLNLTGNISYAGQGQTLIELYNDLKKLKGE